MKPTLVFFASAAHLVLSSPIKNAPESLEPSKLLKVDKPSNFYIEKDLDRKVSATPGGTVTIVRYGPYEIPSMGMLDNVKQIGVPKPCEDCYIVAMQADLQFEDGTSANVEDGAWLHHVVLYSGLGWTPGSKIDLVCSYTLLSGFMGWPHRIFASGNERTPVRLNTKHKFGMSVEKGDYFHLLYDLVNVGPKPAKVYIAMTFEWVPKTTAGYKPARMIWTDITGCGASEAQPFEGTYELRSPGWKSTIQGVMLSTLGHVHDGGVYTTLHVDGKPVCRSDQFYGTKPQFFEKGAVINLSSEEISAGHSMAGMNMTAKPKENDHGHDRNTETPQSAPNMLPLQHISEVSSCVNFGVLHIGENVEIRAVYNTTAHFMNRNLMHDHVGGFVDWLTAAPNDPKFAPIMGINPFYIGEGQMEA